MSTSIDIYPDAHVETVSVDGYAARTESTYDSWANIRAGAGTSANDNNAGLSLTALYTATTNNNRWSSLVRSLLVFDTGANLPDNATIVSATLTLRCSGVLNDNAWSDADAGVAVVNVAAGGSNTAVAAADFARVGTTLQATSKLYSDFVNGEDEVWTLNAAGLATIAANLDAGEVTKFGLRFVADLSDVDPGHKSAKYTSISFKDTEQTPKPKLNIVYTNTASVASPCRVLTVSAKTPTWGAKRTVPLASAKALAVAPKTPLVKTAYTDAVGVRTLAVTPQTPGWGAKKTIDCPVTELEVTCQTPEVITVGAGTPLTVACPVTELEVTPILTQITTGYTTTVPPPTPLNVSAKTPLVKTGLTVVTPLTELDVTVQTPVVSGKATVAVTPEELEVDCKTPVVSGKAVVAVTHEELSVDCKVPAITAGTGAIVPVDCNTLAVSPQTPVVTGKALVTVGVRALSVTAQVPVVQIGAFAQVDVLPEELAVDCKTPLVKTGVSISVSLVSLNVSPKTPIVTAGASKTIAVPVTELDVTAQVPVVGIGKTIVVSVLPLTVTRNTPVVTGKAVVVVSPKGLVVAPKTPVVGIGVTVVVLPVGLAVDPQTPVVHVGTGAIVNVLPAQLGSVPGPPWFHGGATLHLGTNELAVIPGQVRVYILMKQVPTKLSQTGVECNGLSELGVECDGLSETGLGG